MAGRILVIRGGAIGDFILTLPAIGLLRENFPEARLEILGYRHIATLAEGRHYADAVRSIEYGPLAGFFNPKSELDPALSAYFAGFHQVVSYIYDPDRLFASSLEKAGVKNLIAVSPKITDGDHAARQLAQPLEKLALWLESHAPKLYSSPGDEQEAGRILEGVHRPILALHPGSGGEPKRWPLENWRAAVAQLSRENLHFLLVGGEADQALLADLRHSLPPDRRTILENYPLPVLGAILRRTRLYVGHDTGISHLAAAAGARCLLLFGPTDPEIWAPANAGVEVLRAPAGDLSKLDVEPVVRKVLDTLDHAG